MSRASKERQKKRYLWFFLKMEDMFKVHLSDKVKAVLIKFFLWLTKTATGIAIFMFLYYVFIDKLYPRIGFEKTVLIGFIALILSLRGVNEKLDYEE